MTGIRTTSGTLGQLGLRGQLDLGMRLGLRHYPVLLAIALVVDVPLALLAIEGQRSGSSALAFALGLPLVALVNPIGKAATLVAVNHAITGRPVRFGTAYRPVVTRLGVIVAVCALWLLATVAGVIALVIPGIVVLVAGQCLMGAVVLEGRGLRDAAVRSWQLVRPAFWSVLALFLLLEVGGAVVGGLVDLGLVAVLGTGEVAGRVVAVVSRACTSPFLYATLAVLFLDRQAAVPQTGPQERDRD